MPTPQPAGRSAVDLAEFQEDAVKKARRILARYDGVMIADSVGLGKTWIGKKLLEDFAYHMRQQALVVCPASLRQMWETELQAATIPAVIVSQEELGRKDFPVDALRRRRRDPGRRVAQLPQPQRPALPEPRTRHRPQRRPRARRGTQEADPAHGDADQQRPVRPVQPDHALHAQRPLLLRGRWDRRPLPLLLARSPASEQRARRRWRCSTCWRRSSSAARGRSSAPRIRTRRSRGRGSTFRNAG